MGPSGTIRYDSVAHCLPCVVVCWLLSAPRCRPRWLLQAHVPALDAALARLNQALLYQKVPEEHLDVAALLDYLRRANGDTALAASLFLREKFPGRHSDVRLSADTARAVCLHGIFCPSCAACCRMLVGCLLAWWLLRPPRVLT